MSLRAATAYNLEQDELCDFGPRHIADKLDWEQRDRPKTGPRRRLRFRWQGIDIAKVTASVMIHLRNIGRDDLPILFEIQLDPEANRMAVTYPRSADAFAAHWKNALADAGTIAKAIVVGGELVGCISCFKSDDLDVVGYWLRREFWGQGIATRALELLVAQVAIRPLHARVAVTNGASLRVLQKCGFVVVEHRMCPEDERYPACEEAVLELK